MEMSETGKKVVDDSGSDDECLSRAATWLVSRNLVIFGHRTTVRLEDEMWAALKDVAARGESTVNDLAESIHRRKKSRKSFTSFIRVFLMLYYYVTQQQEQTMRRLWQRTEVGKRSNPED
jgi:predicted DNA-binding ribbon-helix-helix protein